MPLVRWHLITCLLTLGLVVGLSVPAQAQRQLLSLDPALPIEGLSQADLDAVGPERLLCRNMLSAVNDMVALLERSPAPDAQYKAAVSAARSSWPRTRGRCDAAVGDLEEGWPRSVLRQEFEQVMGLWTALIRVAQDHSAAAPSKEVEAALDNYQARLDGWREWLDRSRAAATRRRPVGPR
jgi:hypothetical protein